MTNNVSTRLRWLLGVSAVTSLVVLSAAAALAAATGTLTLGASSILPGASTTVDATFSEDASGGVLGGTIVSVIVTPQAGATGAVTLATTDVSCVPASGPQVDCLWSAGTSSKSVALSATASAGARGTFDVTTQVEGDDPDTPGNEIVIRQVQSATITIADPIAMSVAGPTPHPANPDSVSTLEVTYTPLADASNVDASIDLAGTGGNGTLGLVSATNELANCTVSVDERVVSCDYDPTLAGGSSILTVAINVGPGAADGDTYTIFANADRGPTGGVWYISEVRTIDIVAAPATTTTTTVSESTTTTTIPVVQTDLPDTGQPSGMTIALVAGGLIVLGALAVRFNRSIG